MTESGVIPKPQDRVPLERRSLADQLRYLAGKLTEGGAAPLAISVALALHVIADEQDESGPGVTPPGERRPRRLTQTGEMCAGDTLIVFGAEGHKVVIMCDRGDIVLSRGDQDLFARHLFRAMDVADLDLGTDVPF